MAIVLFNPTNETMEYTYIGQLTVLKPGTKLKVDDNRGRHLLANLDNRGLVALEYGDQGDVEERKAANGRKKNLEFKRRQVMRHNQQNEARATSKLPYLEPTAKISEYAEELGIKLLEPYVFGDEQVEKLAGLKQEVAAKDDLLAKKDRDLNAMQGQMSTMQAQLDKLMSLLQGNTEAQVSGDNGDQEQHAVELIEIRKELGYKYLGTDRFEGWIGRNWDKIQTAPPEIQVEIKDKYISLYNRPFPEEQPSV